MPRRYYSSSLRQGRSPIDYDAEIEDVEAEQPQGQYMADHDEAVMHQDMGPLFMPLQQVALGAMGGVKFSFKRLKFDKVSLTKVKGKMTVQVKNESMMPLIGGEIDGKTYFNSKKVFTYKNSGFTIPPNGSKDLTFSFNLNPKNFLSVAKSMVSDRKVTLKTTGKISAQGGVSRNYNYSKRWRW